MKTIEDVFFKQYFSLIAERCYQIACEHGWFLDVDLNKGEQIALMHCELSEALQALRNGEDVEIDKNTNFTKLETELADVILRIMSFSKHFKLDVAGAILAKIEYNKTRPFRHERKF